MANDLRFTLELDGVQKTITSVSDANKVIRELTKNFVLAKESGKDLTTTMAQLNKALEVKQNLLLVSKGAVQTSQSLQGTQSASANASMALLNLNYVIRDSPYFFNNFALGVLAVGNNLNPLIDSFARAKKDARDLGITLTDSLKRALVGGAGISIAFSLVVTAIQSFVFWQSTARREAEKTTGAIDKQKSALERMYDAQISQEIKSTKKRLFEIQRIRPAGGDRKIYDPDTRTFTTRPETPQERYGGFYGEVQELEKRLQLYTKEQNSLGQIESLQRKIALNEQQRNGLNESNFKNYVAQANTLKEAQAIMLQWINYDKAHLDVLMGKTREIEKQVKAAKMLQPDFGGGVGPTARRGFYAGETTNTRMGMRQAERTKAFGFGGMVKDLGIDLEMGKIAAQELGNALSSAFEQGTIKLNEFIQSLTLAIAKMLLLKGITALLTGGFGSGAASAIQAVASTGGKEGMWITSGWGDATRFNNKSVAPTFVFENVVDGQKIIYKGIKERASILR